MNLFIIAPNIKNGGGKELLEYLLEYIALTYPDLPVTAYLDESQRDQKEYSNIKFKFLKSSWEKIKLFYQKFNHALYFGNLPPLRKNRISLVYFHNPYLLMPFFKLCKTSFYFLLKYFSQQLYLKYFLKNVDCVACQTQLVKAQLENKYQPAKVELLPFFRLPEKSYCYDKEYDFCYVALAHPHKNHQLLLDALEILSTQGFHIKLALTVEKERVELIKRIETINGKGIVKIDNFGVVPKNDVCEIYEKSKCLIFPSKEESFGLPLIEAAEMGLDVVAADLPYVYQVVKPSLIFDPENVESCAKAIKSYLSGSHEKTQGLVKNKIDTLIQRLLAD